MIGLILFLGALLMTIGNGIAKGSKQGFERDLVKGYSGDLTLIHGDENTQSIFSLQAPHRLKLLPDYPKLKALLEQQDIIARFLPMSRGLAIPLSNNGTMITDEDQGGENELLLFGVNFADYETMFDHPQIAVEGRLLKNGETGMLISTDHRDELFNLYNIWVVPQGGTVVEEHLPPDALAIKDQLIVKDELVLLALEGTGLESDIRVPVIGVVEAKRFKAANENSYLDMESFRQCFGYLSAEAGQVRLSAEQTVLLGQVEEDTIFAESDQMEAISPMNNRYAVSDLQQQTTRTDGAINTNAEAYQFVSIKLKPGVNFEDGAAQLRRVLAAAGMNLKVLDWRQALGFDAQIGAIFHGVLFIMVLFIFVVAAIVIMNTLSMAAIERTTEIGMMRAIGAQRRFISRMILAEVGLISVIFGGLGMVVGVIVIWGLAALQLPTTADWMLGMLAGGDTLHPIVDGPGFLLGSGQLAVVTVLSVLYPISIARKITPVEAITRD
jgi:ABC-type antimicrobial peptide transport system permease subunit